MSENRSIYASPITWAIILILIIVLGITISSLFSFSDELSGVQQIQEQSGTQQVSERRTVVALSNAQSELEGDLEASDSAQQAAIEAVYSTQDALSEDAATQIAELQQLIAAISTDQAGVNSALEGGALENQATQAAFNETFTSDAANQQTVVAALQETQNALSDEAATREAGLAATIEALSSTQAVLLYTDTPTSTLSATATPSNTRRPTETRSNTTPEGTVDSLPTPTTTPTPSITPSMTFTVIPGNPVLILEGATEIVFGISPLGRRASTVRMEGTYRLIGRDDAGTYYQIVLENGRIGWVRTDEPVSVQGPLEDVPFVEILIPTATPDN